MAAARRWRPSLALTVLFAISARTGYVLVLLLASCAAWLHSPRRWRWLAAIACPLIVLVVGRELGSGAATACKETLAGSQPADRTGAYTSTTDAHRADQAQRPIWPGAMRSPAPDLPTTPTVHEQAARERYRDEAVERGAAPDLVPQRQPAQRIRDAAGRRRHRGAGSVPGLAGRAARSRRACTRLRPADCWPASRSPLRWVASSIPAARLHGGPPLRLAAGVAPRRKPDPTRETEGIRRILVVATRQIGDVLLTTPLLQSARRRWPQARIDVLGFTGTLGMLRGNPDVDQLLEAPGGFRWSSFRSLFWQIWRSYDLALDHRSGRPRPSHGMACRATAQRHRAGPWRQQLDQARPAPSRGGFGRRPRAGSTSPPKNSRCSRPGATLGRPPDRWCPRRPRRCRRRCATRCGPAP